MKVEKIVTISGTYVTEGENTMLHTSTCQCGKLMIRAKKESSLNFYTNNEKYHAKCCGSKLSYTGEKLFKGNEIIEPIAIVNIPWIPTPIIDIKAIDRDYLRSDIFSEEDLETLAQSKVKKEKVVKEKAKGERDVTGLMIMGRNGITNCQMLIAFNENMDNLENLQKLFNTYPDIFISSAKYMKDNHKVILQKIISIQRPEVIIPMGKKAAKEVATV